MALGSSDSMEEVNEFMRDGIFMEKGKGNDHKKGILVPLLGDTHEETIN